MVMLYRQREQGSGDGALVDDGTNVPTVDEETHLLQMLQALTRVFNGARPNRWVSASSFRLASEDNCANSRARVLASTSAAARRSS